MGGKGSGGHNRRSVWEHLADGTYRRGRHGPVPDHIPRVASDQVKCPKWFTDDKKKLFREMAPELIEDGRLDNLSLGPFICLVASIIDIRHMEEQIDNEGSVVMIRGKPKQHPLFAPTFKLERSTLKMLREFKLTPRG